MNEPTLLVFLAKRVHKLLMKLQAHWRARRPKEKKKQANHENSIWKLPIDKKAELSSKLEVKEAYKSSQFDGGRDMLIQGHKKKFFKENFKPP